LIENESGDTWEKTCGGLKWKGAEYVLKVRRIPHLDLLPFIICSGTESPPSK
jgi:hypothetical protein